MSDITLSAGVRQNLLSLQSTASLLSNTQQDLSTGKKVNSAADNPSNFFTSQSLNNRANDLNSLLDSIGQAQQTISSAEGGITSLTNLVQSAKSLATQAQQSATGSVNFTAVTGSTAIAADTTRVSSTATVASAVTAAGVTASVQSNVAINANAFGTGAGSLVSGDTLVFQLGTGTAQTATFTTGAAGANQFTDANSLKTLLNTDFSGKAVASVTGGNLTLTSNDLSSDFGVTGNGVTDAATNLVTTAHTLGSALTISDGNGHSANFFYVASSANVQASQGEFNSAADLVSAISNGASNIHSTITPTAPGGNLQLDSTGSITVGGTLGGALGFGASAANGNFNSTLSAVTGNLSVQVGSGAAHTITFGAANGQVSTKAELQTALSGLTDITGGLNAAGDIQLTPTSSAAVTIGGDPTTVTALGLSLGTTTPSATVVSANSTRSSLQTQYNDLLTQIDQLAGDSSYNGINLLNGDNLKVTFNENGTSSLSIKGVNFSSTGLGLSAVTGTGFQDNNNINNTIGSLNTALTSLRSQAASFGSNLSTVQTRQDFTKDLINTLQTGADNLVLADTNQEGANLLALQTRQQLAITSLSLSTQSDQAILKIL
jgi:flagellin-like hook-associated protein FlgL